ncbi:MAG: helix-turn-helix transcriptional regulator, partial [Methanomassiliicoccales archaeon]
MSFIEDQAFLNNFAQQHEISQRELEVIKLLLQGKNNKEIQDILFISFNTVKNHIYNMYQKLGVNSRGQLWYKILEAKT